jgi:ribosomal protein S18 acetylase RimI-like enzyme
VEIVELDPTDARLDEIYPVLHELRTELSGDEFRKRYEAGYLDGYRVVALYDDGECRAVAGYRILVNFVHGRVLYVDDLVTANAWRSKGYGKALNDHLTDVARSNDCDYVTLDSRVTRAGAHKFYLREGYEITSFHFGRSVR